MNSIKQRHKHLLILRSTLAELESNNERKQVFHFHTSPEPIAIALFGQKREVIHITIASSNG